METVDPIARGQAHLAEGRAADALDAFDQAVRLEPRNALTHFHRARALQALSRWDDAARSYTDALAVDESQANAYYNRGLCRGKKGDHAGALEDYGRYLERHPDDADAWTQIGNRRLDAGDYARSAEAYEKAIALNPADEATLRPWIDLGRKFIALKGEGARRGLAEAYCDRGWAKFDGGEWESAVLWFNRAIEACPEHGDGWHGRGATRGRLRQNIEAADDLQKAVERMPDSPIAWSNLGIVRRNKGDHPGAVTACDEALRLKPDHLGALSTRGLSRGESGDLAGAEADFSRLLALKPDDADAWLNRGWARRKQKRYAEAIADLTRSLELNPKDALAFSNRGYAKRDSGDAAGADADFERAIQLNPAFEADLRPLIAPPAPAAPSPGEPASLIPADSPWPAVGIAAFIIVLGLLKIPFLSAIPGRGVDMGYKTVWMTAHVADEDTFPTKCEICKEPFCTRIDTRDKYVCGRPNYTSENRWNFCPEHSPTFLSTGSRFDGFFLYPYSLAVFAVFAMTWYLLVMLGLRILISPILLILVATKKQPADVLFPWGHGTPGTLGLFLDRASNVVAGGFIIVGLVMYLWW